MREPTLEVLRRLAAITAEGPQVVSVYVRLGVQDRIRTRYRIAARDATRRIAASPPLGSHTAREALRRDLDRVESYLAHAGRLPHAPGLAVFACEALALLEVVPLPRVLKTRAMVGDRPRIAEALAAVDGFGRLLVAAVDRTHTRLFEVTAYEVQELSGLTQPATRGGKFHSDRADSPGWGEHSFHDRMREERHRHCAATARQLAALMVDRPCQGILLAGPGRMVADLERFLPRGLAARVIGRRRVNPTSITPAEIREAALAARDEWERSQERALLGELEEAVGKRWAVNDARAALKALASGQVRVLVIPSDQEGAGFRCADSGRLALARGQCRGEGDPIPVIDLVSEVLEEALRQGVEIQMIDDAAARARVDGLAAFLRFR